MKLIVTIALLIIAMTAFAQDETIKTCKVKAIKQLRKMPIHQKNYGDAVDCLHSILRREA